MVVWKCDLKQPTTMKLGSGIFPESTKQPNGEAVMSKPIKTSNGKCRYFVQTRQVFKASNIFAERSQTLNGENTYTVYSYGYHFPLFVYHEPTEMWFENSNRYSVSTSKHRSQAHPLCPTIKVGTHQLEKLLALGLVDSLSLGNSQTAEAA